MHQPTDRSPLLPTLPLLKQSQRCIKSTVSECVHSFPALLLGTLLNALDAVSYGILIFPAAGVFINKQSIGVSMYLVTGVISQLVYAVGGSGFHGANGTMMVEVIPFFHAIARAVEASSKQPDQTIREREILATTLAAYASSSILTGLCFFAFGALKLGAFAEFFPRHILVGCIGGIGIFLMQTALSVCTEMSGNNLAVIISNSPENLFMRSDILVLWLVPLLLAILLRVITHRFNQQLILPAYFVFVAIIFYGIAATFTVSLDSLRMSGWLLDLGPSVGGPWYTYLTYFDISLVNVSVLVATLPTQMAMLLFNVLHPPLNIPALAVSLDTEMDLDRELIGHGFSNLIAGLCGTIPNYLTYVNTILFYRAGGGTRLTGIALAFTTTLLLLTGTGPLAFIPVPVVGGLIFVLGIDLIKEAVWDTKHKLHRIEYCVIIGIMAVTTAYDFVTGFLFGIIGSCFFFVVQSSRANLIKGIYSGQSCRSPVRRPRNQQAFIRQVSKETTVLRLQGSMFFGNVVEFESTIHRILEDAAHGRDPHPIRFIIVDLSKVDSVDMSAIECLIRVQRLVASQLVTLVLCGSESNDADVIAAMRSAGLLEMQRVRLFQDLQEAIEWTEDVYLDAWYWVPPVRRVLSGSGPSPTPLSPRRSQMNKRSSENLSFTDEPFHTLVRALFSPTDDINFQSFRPLLPHFERFPAAPGDVLWTHGSQAGFVCFIESGTVKAVHEPGGLGQAIDEKMIPGSIVGEFSYLFGARCMYTAVVLEPAILWKLTEEGRLRMEARESKISGEFLQLLAGVSEADHHALLDTVALYR